MLLTSILAGSGRRGAPIPEFLFGRHLPVPTGKVDQVPRICTAGLRKETKARDYNKDGVERFRHVSTKSDTDFIQHLIFIQESVRKTRQLTFFLG